MISNERQSPLDQEDAQAEANWLRIGVAPNVRIEMLRIATEKLPAVAALILSDTFVWEIASRVIDKCREKSPRRYDLNLELFGSLASLDAKVGIELRVNLLKGMQDGVRYSHARFRAGRLSISQMIVKSAKELGRRYELSEETMLDLVQVAGAAKRLEMLGNSDEEVVILFQKDYPAFAKAEAYFAGRARNKKSDSG